MLEYDPDKAPDPKEWLSIDEGERVELVAAYHRKHRIKLPNRQVHAAMHAVVENQIADGYAPTVSAMARLQSHGLSRHDSVHAVAWVVVLHLNDILRPAASLTPAEANERLAKAIDKLTAQLWLDQDDESLFDD